MTPIFSREVLNGNNDLFYSIEGKGKGIWGLRDSVPKDNNVDINEDGLGFIEGNKELRQHIYRERNPKVIRLAKKNLKKQITEDYFVRYVNLTFMKNTRKLVNTS